MIPHQEGTKDHTLEHVYLNTWFCPQLNTCWNLPDSAFQHHYDWSKLSSSIFSLRSLPLQINLRTYHWGFDLCLWQCQNSWIPVRLANREHFLMLSIDRLRRHLEGHEYIWRQLQRACPAYVRNDIRIVEHAVWRLFFKTIGLGIPFDLPRSHLDDIQGHLQHFISSNSCTHTLHHIWGSVQDVATSNTLHLHGVSFQHRWAYNIRDQKVYKNPKKTAYVKTIYLHFYT